MHLINIHINLNPSVHLVHCDNTIHAPIWGFPVEGVHAINVINDCLNRGAKVAMPPPPPPPPPIHTHIPFKSSYYYAK